LVAVDFAGVPQLGNIGKRLGNGHDLGQPVHLQVAFRALTWLCRDKCIQMAISFSTVMPGRGNDLYGIRNGCAVLFRMRNRGAEIPRMSSEAEKNERSSCVLCGQPIHINRLEKGKSKGRIVKTRSRKCEQELDRRSALQQSSESPAASRKLGNRPSTLP
jgi:hypothetical protein